MSIDRVKHSIAYDVGVHWLLVLEWYQIMNFEIQILGLLGSGKKSHEVFPGGLMRDEGFVCFKYKLVLVIVDGFNRLECRPKD